MMREYVSYPFQKWRKSVKLQRTIKGLEEITGFSQNDYRFIPASLIIAQLLWDDIMFREPEEISFGLRHHADQAAKEASEVVGSSAPWQKCDTCKKRMLIQKEDGSFWCTICNHEVRFDK